jgi:uncharacterized membrane protein YGL010W
MSSAQQLLAEYAADHQHPVNKLLHRLCVPAIVVSLLGLLWSLPIPAAAESAPRFVNWATLALAGALAWYLLLSPRLAAGMILVAAVALGIVAMLAELPAPLWLVSVAIFAVAWVGQFVGHAYEGKRPSFLRDLRFLLVGPLWLVASAYGRLGIRVQD